GHDALEAARDQGVPVQELSENKRAPALGPARARRTSAVHRMERRQQASASGVPGLTRRQEARGRSEGRARRGSRFRVRGSGFSFTFEFSFSFEFSFPFEPKSEPE